MKKIKLILAVSMVFCAGLRAPNMEHRVEVLKKQSVMPLIVPATIAEVIRRGALKVDGKQEAKSPSSPRRRVFRVISGSDSSDDAAESTVTE
jgi:hypothetical protein